MILAGVSISTLMGDNGIITQSKDAARTTEIESIREILELSKVVVALENNGKITADKYFDQIIKENVIKDKEKDVIDYGDGVYDIITEKGYIFEVIIKEDDVEIDYVGDEQNAGPKIISINVINKTTKSIEVEVNTKRAENVKYTYSYKKVSESEFKKIKETNENRCTIENLESDTEYVIHVKAENTKGTSEKEIKVMLDEKPTGEIKFGEITWENGKASVTINTESEFDLQYQINGTEGQWTNIEKGGVVSNLINGNEVYARLTDGINYGEAKSIVISDSIAPTVTITTEEITTKSIKVNVTSSDEQSGMSQTPEYIYYIKTSEGEYGTAVYTGTNASYTFTGLIQNTNYDIKVTTTDKVGNVGTVIKTGIKTEKVGGSTGDLTNGNIIASSPIWSGGKASVTLSTKTGLTIQYQVNGTTGEWKAGTSVTGLNHNDIVYARLWDGVNAGEAGSVTIKDTGEPTVTITTGTVKTNSITVSVSSSDAQWGMPASPTYNYYIRTSSGSYGAVSYTGTNTSYTFTGLKQNTDYEVKVTTTDKAGNTGTGIKTPIKTATVGGATGGLTGGNITASSPVWSGGTASITLSTTTGLTIQWQKGGTTGSWTSGTSVTGLNHNDTVYARLWDGINAGQPGSVIIKDTIAPTVTVTKAEVTTKSVVVNASATDAQWGMTSSPTYSYYIRTTSGSYGAAAYTGTNKSYTFNNLADGTSYVVKVTVADKAGNVGSKELTGITTGTVGGATGGLTSGNITASSPVWSRGTASITLSTTTGLTIQWQKGGTKGSWTSGTSVTGLNHNDTVYARLWDGTNGGQPGSVTIKDAIEPTVTVTKGTVKTNAITVSVGSSDAQWGIPTSPQYTYYIKKTSEADTAYVAKSTNSTSKSYTFTGLLQNTSYDIKVTSADKAGNIGTGKLINTQTTTVGGSTGGLTSGNIIASAPTWSNGTASITLSTTTGLTIQWQKGRSTGSWTSGTSVTGLNHNDTVYARLWDGTNAGQPGSVTIKDTIAPTVTVTKGTVKTNAITVSVSSSDAQWGMSTSPTYSYYIRTSSGSYGTAAYTGTNKSYTFNNLTDGTSYVVKVTVADKAGNVGSKELTGITTGTVGGATGGLTSGNIIASAPTWSNGTARITLSTTTGLTIQWQKGGTKGSWTSGTSVTGLNHNDTVYARLWDGVNAGSFASVTIKDGVKPTITINSDNIEANSITVNVVCIDGQWGMPTSPQYTYYIKKTGEADSAYVAKLINSTSTSYTFTNLTAETSYDIKVTSKDKAGNVGTGNSTINNYEIFSDIYTSTKEYIDSEGNKAWIPKGFAVGVSGPINKISKGLVITDKIDQNHKSIGNQFVWIPVGDYNTSTGTKTNYLLRVQWGGVADIPIGKPQWSTNRVDIPIKGHGDLNDRYGTFKGESSDSITEFLNQSTNPNKCGFYIGRYEQGIGNVVQKNKVVLTQITKQKAEEYAQELYKGNQYVGSDLINSFAWDTTLNFLCQTSKDGYNLAYMNNSNYGNIGSGTRQERTGLNVKDKNNNIYDFVGNVMEWSTETSTPEHLVNVGRGGYAGNEDYFAATRFKFDLNYNHAYIGFRTVLYVK